MSRQSLKLSGIPNPIRVEVWQTHLDLELVFLEAYVLLQSSNLGSCSTSYFQQHSLCIARSAVKLAKHKMKRRDEFKTHVFFFFFFCLLLWQQLCVWGRTIEYSFRTSNAEGRLLELCQPQRRSAKLALTSTLQTHQCVDGIVPWPQHRFS